MRDLLAELSRRNVFKVAMVYVITAWVVLQVADVLFPALHLPEWTLTFVAALLLLGFPMALVFSWAFEITPDGLMRSEDVQPGVSITHLTGRKLDFLIIAALAIAVITLLSRQVALQDRLDASEASVAEAVPEQSAGGMPSIAVLPFDDLSEAADNGYFADGISEEILNALVSLPDLQVVGRTSSFALRDKGKDLREIGNHLNATHILEGSVRKSGNRVRITAQLIDATTGYHDWSDTYEAQLDDIFLVQEKISRSIAQALKIELRPDTLAVLSSHPTSDTRAYDVYLQGRGVLRSAASPEDYDRALELFDRALRRDPVFAEAEAGKCEALFGKYWETRDQAFLEPAIDTCDRAATRSADNLRVQVALGNLYLRTGRQEFARDAFQRALALDDESDDVHRGLGDALAADDMSRAEAHYLEAIRLAPDYARNHANFAVALFRAGRLEEADQQFMLAIADEPENPRHYSNLGGLYIYQGRFGDAATILARALELDPSPRAYGNAGTNYYYDRQYGRAAELFRGATELAPDDYRWRGNLADACRYAGCRRPARHHYEIALRQVSEHLRVDPDDAVAESLRALYLARLERPDEARARISRAVDMAGDSIDVAWAEAVTRTALSDLEGATLAVERAVALGYPAAALRADPDLEPVFRLLEGRLSHSYEEGGQS